MDPLIDIAGISLDLRTLNHNIIGSNIANSETPGYKTKRMEFEGALREMLELEDAIRLNGPGVRATSSNFSPEIFEDQGHIYTLDENTVDRSLEMSKLAENQIIHQATIEALRRKLGMLKYAVNEGGGK
jgi:flagellar basal-body rod protein FlgB